MHAPPQEPEKLMRAIWKAAEKGNSQHLEYFHKAAEDTVGLSAEFDANATAGGADHQTVDQVGLAVVANAGGHLLVGHVVAFHLHVDLIGRDND